MQRRKHAREQKSIHRSPRSAFTLFFIFAAVSSKGAPQPSHRSTSRIVVSIHVPSKRRSLEIACLHKTTGSLQPREHFGLHTDACRRNTLRADLQDAN